MADLVLDVVALERERQSEAGVVHEHRRSGRSGSVSRAHDLRRAAGLVEQVGGEHLDVDAVTRPRVSPPTLLERLAVAGDEHAGRRRGAASWRANSAPSPELAPVISAVLAMPTSLLADADRVVPAGSDSGCRCATCAHPSAGSAAVSSNAVAVDLGRQHVVRAGETVEVELGHLEPVGRADASSRKSSPPPMTQIRSGRLGGRCQRSASSSERARSAPSADQLGLAGDDDVAPAGQRAESVGSESHVLRPMTTGARA